ncbi:MAG TPA: hemerythrin domain-containing protein, partial [Polyangia bacterium]
MESLERLRRQILAEHGELRAAIAKVATAEEPARLALATNALCDLLADHLGHEDDELEPVLRTIDAWGPERARRLRDEHAAQRARLAQLRRDVATAPSLALAREVQPFLETLLAE